MKSLFPDMDEEIRQCRIASKRERVQWARVYLRKRNLSPMINYMLERGPQTDHFLIVELELKDIAGKLKGVANIILDLHALWLTKKLWRISQGKHMGSGQQSFLYGINRVHPKP